MIASYILSRTLVPTLAMYLLKPKQHGGQESRSPFVRFQRGFERLFEKRSPSLLVVAWPACFLADGLCSGLLDRMPLCLRARSISRSGFLSGHRQRPIYSARARKDGNAYRGDSPFGRPVETSIRQTVPPAEVDNILDKPWTAVQQHQLRLQSLGTYWAGPTESPLVSLKKEHHGPQTTCARCVRSSPANFLESRSIFLPADIVTQR